jgi:hypothetical protein
MKKERRLIGILILTLLWAGLGRNVQAQTVSIHTNAILWAGLGANVGVDFAVNDYQTIGATAIVTMGDSWIKKVNGSGIQLDYRFWFKRKLFQDFFVGPQLGLYHYRMDEDSSVKRHDALTAGLVSGYGWMISRHWNVDVFMGAGFLLYAEPDKKHKFVPTNLGANISYVF